MIYCENCFKDLEIKDIIKHANNKGRCSICLSDDVYIYDTDGDSIIEEMFNEILDIYYLESELDDNYPEERLNLLKEELYSNWNIFNIKPDKISILIKEICKTKYDENPRLFRNSIGIKQFFDKSYLINNSIMKIYTWDKFVDEIKTQCRFHNDFFNKDVFTGYLKYMNKSYKKGELFYRARVSGERGFSKEEMGAPPLGEATGGRANPMGISYLYLASDSKTAVSEVRAGALDYITVAKFELLKDIKIIDFEKIDKISPFFDEMDITQLGINNKILKVISEEISKPLGGNGRALEYLPTQYISDYIKSIGEWQGIKYKSTLGDGYNLAVFDEKLFECKSVAVKRINKLNYSYL